MIPYGILYLIFAMFAGCGPLASWLVLIPTTHEIKLVGGEQFSIPYEDGSIDVWKSRTQFQSTDEPSAFVLIFSGNGSRAEEMLPYLSVMWQDHDVELWAVNYPGYGKSTPPARLQSAAEAALTAYDELRKLAKDRPIYVHGTSLGTTVSLHIAANRSDVAGLVLKNPPPLRQLIQGRFGWWNLWLLSTPISLGIPSDLDSIGNAKRCKMKALFVMSGQDEIVPIRFQKLVYDAYAGTKIQIDRDDAGHNDSFSPSEQKRIASDINNLIGGSEKELDQN